MTEQGMQHAQRLATLLSGGIRGGGYYPAGHPASLQPFREMALVASVMHREGGEIRLAVVDGVLSVGEHLFFAPTAPLQELSRRLEEKGVFGITLKPGVSDQDLMALARLMAEPAGGAAELKEGLALAAISSIEVREEDNLAKTYNEAVGAIRDIFYEIGNGRIPNSRRMLTVVSSLASAAVREPAALLGLTMIKDYDNYTFQHSVNVGVLAMALSASMGQPADQVEQAGMAGFLHDVGKTRVNKGILNKPGKLSNDEYLEMKKHPEFGAEIVRQMEGVPAQVAEAVLGHHIRHDREGYPEWARSFSFGVASGIVAVADCYDATTTLRAYQRPMQPKQAVDKIRSLCGTSLDGEIVERFLELTGRFPTGSLVRLDSNEIAVVFTPSSQECGAAVVKVIMDGTGSALREPELRSLAGGGGFVVDLVDPLVKGIDVSRYF
ncbi:MAG: HD family phosphohydrolase [Geobacteraceae bacterium GWC2_58_44]|nr:MAG: HD family phosphohydrolase [Geobacteraceae bacterium GWC2_58_44]HBG07546.1 HD family phosphohydrolase [Geobacter sp.]